LDTRYFIWFEEVDYCKNAHTKGWDVVFVPWIHATDYVGRSFKQQTRYWAQKQFSRSMVQYFEKWHSGWQSMLLKALRPLGLASGWLVDRWRALQTKPKKVIPS
jgi:GT2 family glycosyltransferase